MNPMFVVILLIALTVVLGVVIALAIAELETPTKNDAKAFGNERWGNCTVKSQNGREFGLNCNGRPYVVNCSNPRNCEEVE